MTCCLARLRVFDCAARTKVSETCRVFGINRSTFYVWKRRAERHGLEILRVGCTNTILLRVPGISQAVRTLSALEASPRVGTEHEFLSRRGQSNPTVNL
jgi:transposase-like protein